MARYYSVRGWLECAHEDIPKVHELISSYWATAAESPVFASSTDLYRGAWVFPETKINWTGFVYFGADIRAEFLDFVRDCLLLISRSNLDVDGYFHIDDEEQSDRRSWQIEDHKFFETARLPPFAVPRPLSE
jgi:hypothetical protein